MCEREGGCRRQRGMQNSKQTSERASNARWKRSLLRRVSRATRTRATAVTEAQTHYSATHTPARFVDWMLRRTVTLHSPSLHLVRQHVGETRRGRKSMSCLGESMRRLYVPDDRAAAGCSATSRMDDIIRSHRQLLALAVRRGQRRSIISSSLSLSSKNAARDTRARPLFESIVRPDEEAKQRTTGFKPTISPCRSCISFETLKRNKREP